MEGTGYEWEKQDMSGRRKMCVGGAGRCVVIL